MVRKMSLAGIFGNGMVLQRGAVNKLWGIDSSAEQVAVLFEGRTYVSPVKDGKFAVELPEHETETGITIIVQGSDRIVLEDVCFGDVFMLSGQSNMELPVSRVLDVSAEEISSADFPYIRQYCLTPRYVFGESEEAILPEAVWTRAIPGEIEEMSAVGFFFAKKLQETIKVPIGLILNAQGGATIEAWMPMEQLEKFGDYYKDIQPFQREGYLARYIEDREKRISDWYKSIDAGNWEERSRIIPEGAKSIALPGMYPVEEEKSFSGSIWFYRGIILEKKSGKQGLLYVGELIDSDKTYINGVFVGETSYRYPPRKYFFNSSILQKGKNLIAVRLVIEKGRGGFIPGHPYYMDSGSEKKALDGNWFYKVEKHAAPLRVEDFQAQKLPTGLFRASIVPLRGLALKGVLWYQGESNAGEPERYDEKFASMINSWRKALNQTLPVICVELADYCDPITGIEPGWAVIQEMQRNAPDTVERCAIVSAKGMEASYELHPQFKSSLGRQLAEKALNFFYQL